MFGSKKKSKKKTIQSGFDPPITTVRSKKNDIYETVDESKKIPPAPVPGGILKHRDNISIDSTLTLEKVKGPSDVSVVVVNASDDFKIDTLKTKSPELLALSRHHDVGNSAAVITDKSVGNVALSANVGVAASAAPPPPHAPPPPAAPPLPAGVLNASANSGSGSSVPPPPAPAPPPSPPAVQTLAASHTPSSNVVIIPPAAVSKLPAPVPEQSLPTSDRKRNLAIFSSIPGDSKQLSGGSDIDTEGSWRSKLLLDKIRIDGSGPLKRRSEKERSNVQSDSFDNPVFVTDNRKPPIPSPDPATLPRFLKSQQNHFPSLKKQVSWNNTVVYSSGPGAKTDITITGLPEDESETSQHGVDYEPTSISSIPADDDTIDRKYYPELGPEEDDSESGIRPRRIYTDRHDIGLSMGRRPPPTQRKKGKNVYKCSVCFALVLLALAVVGLAVLGTLYGVRYGNESSVPEQISEIKQIFSMQATTKQSVFIKGFERPPSQPSRDGVSYYLLEHGTIMPWQSPEVSASLVWLKGSPVKTYILDRSSRILSPILGDPTKVTGSQYTLSLENTDWYAAKLQDPDGYAFIALTINNDSPGWVSANTTRLIQGLQNKDQDIIDQINQFQRP